MRAGPPLRSPSILLLAGCLTQAGCFLDASPFGVETTGAGTSAGGSGGTTSTSTATGAGGASTTSPTTSNGGSGGATTTDTTGGGGSGGTTTTDTTGGGGSGGTTTTTTTTPTTPTSCKDALTKEILTSSGTVFIDPDGDVGPAPLMEVYCDQETDGGGWALVHSSNGSAAGTTTAFWNIPYAMRFDTKVDPSGPPDPGVNYYAGWLYQYGKQYRDDVVDMQDVEVKGAMRAICSGFNETTMKFTGGMQQAGSLSPTIFYNNFNIGWASADQDNDGEAGYNCAAKYANVTQHYGGCWAYNLGASTDVDPTPTEDYTDMGWGPHMLNAVITEINNALPMGDPKLALGPGGMGEAARVKRLSRFTKW